ncbi:MAG: acyltransferase family protein, partial [Oscillospiraceae bacterium]|nr:acyltransferase family protein [Oscillospiraceae bacterium]
DLVKFIAMCLVVCIHTTHDYIVAGSVNIEYILYNSAVVAIPLFFMVSGYLLIGRENVTYKYAARKILRILRFIFLVVTLWWLAHRILFKTWDIDYLIYDLEGVFTQKGTFGIFWYFGALSILYCVYPLVNQLTQTPKYYFAVLILIGIAQNLAFSWSLVGTGECSVIQVLRIWNWLFYFMLGGALKNLTFNKIFLTFLILLAGGLNLYVIKWLSPYIATTYCEYFYSCPVVILYASSIFVLCKELHVSGNRFTRELSPLFLPVYTFHSFVIGILASFGINEFGGLVFYIAVLICTIAVSWIVMKIPYVNKVFRI